MAMMITAFRLKINAVGVIVIALLVIAISSADQQQQRNINRPNRLRQFWSSLPAIHYGSYPFSAYPSYSFYESLQPPVEAPFNPLYHGYASSISGKQQQQQSPRWNPEETDPNSIQSRQNSVLNGLFSRPAFSALLNYRPLNTAPSFSEIVRNPTVNTVAAYATPNNALVNNSCVDADGMSGVCVPVGPICAGFGGKASTSCRTGSVCCINTVSTCGSSSMLNNTYWSSSASAAAAASQSGTTCSLSVDTGSNLNSQRKAICQIRLDFVSFSIAQPDSETVCSDDTFQVIGATNNVPTICGDNAGQHMYLTPTSSTANVILLFSFGPVAVARSWNIKVSLLPCDGSDYLAPTDCLQYFTGRYGTISSFNWKDTSDNSTRQLANQGYNICFRTELLSSQLSSQFSSMCLSTCATTNGGSAFSLSGSSSSLSSSTRGKSQLAAQGSCNNDFVIFSSGFDPSLCTTAGSPASNTNDRFCGDVFAVQAAASNPPTTICSKVKPFMVYYETNSDESITATVDALGVGNRGFCFNYQQRMS